MDENLPPMISSFMGQVAEPAGAEQETWKRNLESWVAELEELPAEERALALAPLARLLEPAILSAREERARKEREKEWQEKRQEKRTKRKKVEECLKLLRDAIRDSNSQRNKNEDNLNFPCSGGYEEHPQLNLDKLSDATIRLIKNNLDKLKDAIWDADYAFSEYLEVNGRDDPFRLEKEVEEERFNGCLEALILCCMLPVDSWDSYIRLSGWDQKLGDFYKWNKEELELSEEEEECMNKVRFYALQKMRLYRGS